MKNIIILIGFIIPIVGFSQVEPQSKLLIDSATSKFVFKKVFELNSVSANEIHDKIIAYGKDAKSVVINNETTIVLKYESKLGAYKYVSYLETFEMKENKYRYTLSDITYLLDATDDSEWKPVETIKKQDEVIEKVNDILNEKLLKQQNEIIDAKPNDW